MRSWTGRQVLIAVTGSVAIAAAMGVVADLIPNPLFVRMIEAPWWSYPVWIASAVMSGLLLATYAAPGAQSTADRVSGQRRNLVGAVLSFLAVGCPTCNKLVVVALGMSGAITWFGPMQPVLAAASLGLLGFALRARLRASRSCPASSPVRRP